MRYSILMVVCLVFGCTNPKIIVELDLADRLMNNQPDSAHVVLKGIDMEGIRSEQYRALYALLFIQAYDKIGQPVDSDSLIDVAVDYYRGSSDKRRYARSLLYMSRFQVSIDSTESAIETLKNAERVATNADDLALINFDIGHIYYCQHQFDAAIERYVEAARHFRIAGNHKNLGLTYGNIGTVYRLKNNQDSSLLFINKALNIAKERQDTAEIINSLTMVNFVRSEFVKNHAANLRDFQKVFLQYNNGIIPTSYRRSLMRLYYNANKLDSARIVALECVANEERPKQSFILYLARIENAVGNYKQAYDYRVEYTRLSDSTNRVKVENNAAMIEKRYDNHRLKSINNQLQYSRKLWISLAVTFMLLFLIGFMTYRNRIRRKEREITDSKQFIGTLQTKISQVTPHNNESFEEAFHSGADIIRQLLNLSFLHGSNDDRFYDKFSTIMSVKSNRKELLSVLVNIVEAKHPKLFEIIGTKHPELNENETIFLGLILGGFTYQELSVIYKVEYHSVVVRLSRIKKKIGDDSANSMVISDITK